VCMRVRYARAICAMRARARYAGHVHFISTCAVLRLCARVHDGKQKRKLRQEESMKEAVAYVQNGHGLRKAARLYNVPVETLRRRQAAK